MFICKCGRPIKVIIPFCFMGTGAKALFLVLIQEARQSGGYEPTSIFNFLVRWNHRSLYEVLTLLGYFHGPWRLVSGRGMCFYGLGCAA